MEFLHTLFKYCTLDNPLFLAGAFFLTTAFASLVFYHFDQKYEAKRDAEWALRVSQAGGGNVSTGGKPAVNPVKNNESPVKTKA